jgi:hypothetical protein
MLRLHAILSSKPQPTLIRLPHKSFNPILEPVWAQESLTTYDPLDLVFPSNEVLKAMIGPNIPWDDLHHKSDFLPKLKRIEA